MLAVRSASIVLTTILHQAQQTMKGLGTAELIDSPSYGNLHRSVRNKLISLRRYTHAFTIEPHVFRVEKVADNGNSNVYAVTLSGPLRHIGIRFVFRELKRVGLPA
ncbi:hypothetical protein LTS18_006541 [Coniosporium uncinatum]|uniref:Uncharacterized protein n=1 Tax=Coniosporium uncinatum TaxID=93489 RepID=A0ACC3DXK5_9PEZI|nr:hypothetical protein LTS18_006541 [Coniosporium uncinatum]